MNLDEIEKLARSIVTFADSFHSPSIKNSDDAKLARAVLAMVPLCRAVVRWRECDESPNPIGLCCHDDVADAVDALRAAMEEK